MKVNLSIFAALVLIVVSAAAQEVSGTQNLPGPGGTAEAQQARAGESPLAATSQQSSDGAELLIERVVAAFTQQPSVAARIHFHAELFGQQTDGKGIYLQQGLGRERQFRLELQTAIGQNVQGPMIVTLVDVCDGKYLWDFRQWPGKQELDKPNRPTVNRLDLERVRQALEQGQRHLPQEQVNEYAFGGLLKLLGGLQSSFQFTRAAADHLDFNNPQAGRPESLPVWSISGAWRADALRSLSSELSDQALLGQPLNLTKLPTQAPEQVTLLVGQDDMFPYRIEFLRREAKQGRGANVGPGNLRPILTVNLFEVRLGAAIDPQQFVYQPGDAEVIDTTAGMIKELDGASDDKRKLPKK